MFSKPQPFLVFGGFLLSLYLVSNAVALDYFLVKVGKKNIACVSQGQKITPGTISKNGEVFTSFTSQIGKIKSSIKKSKGTQKRNLSTKLKSLQELAKKAKRACEKGASIVPPPGMTPTVPVQPSATIAPPPTATKAPQATATPYPTISPTPPSENFDANGNVTVVGKERFGIPLNLSANIGRGQQIHTSSCLGCHSQYNDNTFSYYRNRIALPPMNFSMATMPDSELADLVAYLNRYWK